MCQQQWEVHFGALVTNLMMLSAWSGWASSAASAMDEGFPMTCWMHSIVQGGCPETQRSDSDRALQMQSSVEQNNPLGPQFHTSWVCQHAVWSLLQWGKWVVQIFLFDLFHSKIAHCQNWTDVTCLTLKWPKSALALWQPCAFKWFIASSSVILPLLCKLQREHLILTLTHPLLFTGKWRLRQSWTPSRIGLSLDCANCILNCGLPRTCWMHLELQILVLGEKDWTHGDLSGLCCHTVGSRSLWHGLAGTLQL